MRPSIASVAMPFAQPHPRVLCVSRDACLRETRRLILMTRYEAGCVGSVEEIEAVPPAQELDLLLLCHSLCGDESARAVEIGRRRWPGVKILAISNEESDAPAVSDETVRGLDGPLSLLETIDRLLLQGLRSSWAAA